MSIASIWSLFTKILDICIVWLLFYFVLKNIRNNVKMVLILKGVILIIVIKILSQLLNLYTVGLLLEYIVEWGPLAIIVVFQPEIRNMLESIGRTQLLGRHKVLTVDEREKMVTEIMKSVEYLKRNRIGALIVIERDVSLQEYIDRATKIYADISNELLSNLFFPNSPLHDGGVIIQGDRITCAGAVFKTSMNPNVSKKLGTRHRAALGVSEESDALALIISEETGRISIALDGKIAYNLTLDEFRMTLMEELKPKTEVFYDAEEESTGEEHE
ncbi:MAG: diadenylate cyclase CdaA [Bacilli bacterium]|nr:diadenylate cyclase CdaA [Bacilli bacterium]MBR1817536.1 diadenylate cyclase CdaA [Bacilli bacterium]